MKTQAVNCKKLLVIDDDPDIRAAFRDVLESEGYEVMTAGNGKEGLRILRADCSLSLVLLDMMMPVMDGEEFLRLKCCDPQLNTVPVLVVSATADARSARGANDLIGKPVDIDHLLKSVAENAREQNQLPGLRIAAQHLKARPIGSPPHGQ